MLCRRFNFLKSPWKGVFFSLLVFIPQIEAFMYELAWHPLTLWRVEFGAVVLSS